ncbi:hypothetical protein ONE63_000818 [Megalurothrips usitatus]|uniref:Uncharacterized protein n=1 Tax=Megalurothrips usitatus TaxID=439358 RepID=A0AAV7Y3E5_9NEOP|nr:hypothetical protein ONE63_000818 [Megalurothrips usitatus]
MVAAAGPPDAATDSGGNDTLRWLESLSEQYAPLPHELCQWMADGPYPGVGVAAANCTEDALARLPRNVCRSLIGLGFPLANDTAAAYCLETAPELEEADVIRGSMLAVLALLSVVGNCYTIHSIRNKAGVSVGHPRRGDYAR